MLTQLTDNQLLIGILQALIAAILAISVIYFAKSKQINIAKDSLIALIRAVIQIVLISLVLITVFTGPLWLAIPILAGMMFAAGMIAGKRAKESHTPAQLPFKRL